MIYRIKHLYNISMTQWQSHVENKTVFYCCGSQTAIIIYIYICALPAVTQTLMLRFPESFIFKSALCSELSISVNAKNNVLLKFYGICQTRIKTTTSLTPPSPPALTAQGLTHNMPNTRLIWHCMYRYD